MMISMPMLRPLRFLAGPARNLIRMFPRLNAASWDIQYRLGFWRFLDSNGTGGELFRVIQKYCDKPDILDLGCGTSASLPLLPGAYRHYHGVDISSEAIKRAESLGRPHTSYEAADVLHYDPQGSYDVILLLEVIYYLPVAEITQLLRRLSGFLRPGGVMIVQLWSGAPDHDRVTAAIEHTGLVLARERRSAELADNAPMQYVLAADSPRG